MREDVKKILFIGVAEDKNAFFKKSQSHGLIHFIDPQANSPQIIPEEIERVLKAIKILRSLPVQEQLEGDESEYSLDKIITNILEDQLKIQNLQEEQRILNIEISRIAPFGDFSLEDISNIEQQGQCYFQFFSARQTAFHDTPVPNEILFVSTAHGLDYYIGINHAPFSHPQLTEMHFESSLNTLAKQEMQVHTQLRQFGAVLKEYAKYNDMLHRVLIDKMNKANLNTVHNYVTQTMDGALFAVEGWVPANKIHAIDDMLENLDVYHEEIALDKSDVPVTCLQNHGVARLGEDLVHIYDTPSATDNDPSVWVLFGFTLFFSFIIGDAGYGLIYLVIALFLRYKYPKMAGLKKRILNLCTILFTGCVIWGTLMTSFFGMQIAPNNPLRKVSLLHWLAEKKAAYHMHTKDSTYQSWLKDYPELENATNPYALVSFTPSGDATGNYEILNALTDNIMFELALFVGVVHLLLSMSRYALRIWSSVGWMLFLIGAYLYFPYYLEVPSLLNYVFDINLAKGGQVGLQLLLSGLAIAWIMGIIQHGWTGIFEITVVIQVFADTLSYLRLYALGLSGALVGATINEFASAMPLLLGILLVVIAHFVNMVLCTMSAVIHGLRLNFLEWYHYSFEGGGKPFRPLKLLKAHPTPKSK